MLGSKKAPKTGNNELDRVIAKIYDDINHIINAVNNYEGTFEQWKGKAGDVRVTEKGIQFRDKHGWKTVSEDTHTHPYADDDHTH